MADDLLPGKIVNLSAAVVETLHLPLLQKSGVTVDVLRLDKIDPVVSGNKWFKLKYYLKEALEKQQQTLLTFGGAWSNHIVATASAAQKLGLNSIGLIRGEAPAILSTTLQTARHFGMQLTFLSRGTYNQKTAPAFIEQLLQQYHHPCIIPEGGAAATGIKGAAEIMRLFDSQKYTHLFCAMGTGTMLQGLASCSLPNQQLVGIPVLKGFDNWMPPHGSENIRSFPGYHFGGYAKKTSVLIDFMNVFYRQTAIPTDFVYTGKLFFAVLDLIEKNYFPAQSRILVVHSGGLQGNSSLPAGTLVF